MARNKIFEKIPITLPQRSGFDLSHENCGTGKPGILIPVMTREMQGRDSLSVNLGAQIQFPPFATDFYGRIKCYFEAFFVPYRIIDGSYKSHYAYIASDPSSIQSGDGLNPFFEGIYVSRNPATWTFDETADPSVKPLEKGSLLDYLGFKVDYSVGAVDGEGNELRVLLNNRHRLDAYHLIWAEYYRDSRLQVHPYSLYRGGSLNSAQMRYTVADRATPYNNGNKYILPDGPLGDGVYLTGLRSRPYAKDYFTTATLEPQFGNEMSVQADANGNISISQIRAANALQQYMEVFNKAGKHYDDLAFALTGIRPSDAAVDIPVYLGRQVYDVYNKSIYQTNEFSDIPVKDEPNPYKAVGGKFANGQALGSGHLCDFTATEGGIFMVLMSVVPEAIYGTGVARQWNYNTIFDLPVPHLAGIGDQPIYKGELIENLSWDGVSSYISPFNNSDIFGYSQRFAEAKFMLDEVHGELRDTGLLKAFSLKRSFNSSVNTVLGTDFITVRPDSLEEVSVFYDDAYDDSPSSEGDVSRFYYKQFYWYDCYFEVKLVSNLPAFSLPTLENMHGPSVMVDNGGRRF